MIDDDFIKRVRKELVPKIKDADIFVSITPMDENEVDVKFSLEIGMAIMFDKPIIATFRPGTKIPEKLARVVDRFVEMDENDMAGSQARLKDAIQEMIAKSPPS